MSIGKESERLEFKKTTSELKEAIKSISAILNKHGGGELLFGVRNDGTPVGQDISEKTLREISQAISNSLEPKVYPTISEVVLNGKQCISVKFNGTEAPYFAYGRAYIRVADENKVISPTDLKSFFKTKIERENPWDSAISDTEPEKIKAGILKKYIQRGNQVDRIDFSFTNKLNVLEKLKLIDNGKLKNAGMVYFTEMPLLYIQMAVFATKEKNTFLDISRGSGSVPELIAIGEEYIKKNIRWRAVFGNSMQRDEVPEVPVSAIRETLMNSFCHRDYKSTQNNEIAIYSDRIEIYNPGLFPENYTPDDFIKGEGCSIKRNPLLADLMYYVKDIENFGTGLKKIYDACEKASVKVDFKIRKLGFSVVFYRHEIHQNIENSDETVKDDRLHAILEFCKTPRTRKEIQDYIGITDRVYFGRIFLNPLIESGKLSLTMPDNPKDRRQKYFTLI